MGHEPENLLLPSVLNLELTNACNLECVFCDHPVLKKTMEIKELDCSLLEKILDDVSDIKTFELGLVGLGEPLLNKNFPRHLKIINRYKEKFERISLNSNAVSLTREISENICHSAINYLTFSINASNKEAYLKLMKRDKYEVVLENVKQFLEVRRRYERYDLKVSIQALLSDLNDENVFKEVFADYLGENVFTFFRDLYNKPVLDGQNELGVSIHFEETRYPCWSIFSRIYIDVNGYFYPCTIGNDCYRETSALMIGNVKRDSVLDLFRCHSLIDARRRAVEAKLPFPECSKCNVWSLLPNNFEWDAVNNIWINKGQTLLRPKQYDLASCSSDSR